MNLAADFCTCGDHSCPFHPTNHNEGCAPCIKKNLAKKHIPNCYFNLLENKDELTGYGLEDFAKLVLKGK